MAAFDVIVVGGGGAGAAAAVAARRRGASVALLSKEPAGYGDTRIAEGGFTYPGRWEEDTPEVFFADVMKGGEQLSDPRLVDALVRDAETGILSLEAFGYLMRRDANGCVSGEVAQRAGGHNAARTVGGVGRGVHIGVALRAGCARAGVKVLENRMAVRLLKSAGRVRGVVTYDLATGERETLLAGAVILATGGTGWLYYPHTDCVRSATGDGYALALQAGAELIEMEQVQFLPFGLTHPEPMVGIFCAETGYAGPHGRLVDGEGRVVLEGVSRMTRAQVTRVMARLMKGGRVGPHGGLFLDLRPNLAHDDGVMARELLVNAGAFQTVKRAYGRKAFEWQEPLEVLPTAHYHMGGVRTDQDGRSAVPGLYAAGAVQGGVHGGNRLGSVALTEILVFGLRAGDAAAREALEVGAKAGEANIPSEQGGMLDRRGRYRPIVLMRRLQQLMWAYAGPMRDEAGLEKGLAGLDRLTEDASDLSIAPGKRCNTEMREALELPLMLLTAQAIMRSALARRESRGAHLREDFPGQAPALSHTVAWLDGRLAVSTEAISA